LTKLYFEDIEAGRQVESPWVEVDRDEIVQFARDWDPYDFHLDEKAAKESIFGGLAACAAHIFAISSKLSHQLPDELALVAGLGGDGLHLLAPIYAGDRVRLVRRFTQTRASKSKPEAGIITIEDTLESPDGKVVFRTSGSMLIARRPASAIDERHTDRVERT
jgi:acyl dehydratase